MEDRELGGSGDAVTSGTAAVGGGGGFPAGQQGGGTGAPPSSCVGGAGGTQAGGGAGGTTSNWCDKAGNAATGPTGADGVADGFFASGPGGGGYNGSVTYKFSGAPDPGWSNDALHLLDRLRGRDFEVVNTASLPHPGG